MATTLPEWGGSTHLEGVCVVTVLLCHHAIGGEELEVHEVILLDVVHEVVDQHRRHHGGQGEHSGGVLHRGLDVKRALCVHQYDCNLEEGKTNSSNAVNDLGNLFIHTQ